MASRKTRPELAAEVDRLGAEVLRLERELDGQRILSQLDRAEVERLRPFEAEALRWRSRDAEHRERDALRKAGVKHPPRRRPQWTDADDAALNAIGIPYEALIQQGLGRAAACTRLAGECGKSYDAIRAALVRLDNKKGIGEPPPPSRHR